MGLAWDELGKKMGVSVCRHPARILASALAGLVVGLSVDSSAAKDFERRSAGPCVGPSMGEQYSVGW